MRDQLEKVDLILQGQRHQPELAYIYIFLSVGLGLQFLGFFVVHFLKNCIVNWILSNQHQGWLAGRGYNECPAPQPCCPPLINRPRPRGAREEQGGANNYAVEPEMSQTGRTTSGVSSPHMGERSKRHPVTSL